MSYQVLARKWRPRTFTEMVGQEHVLRALINGLDHDRLHHAYLFTGTRGVGKTTLARILAKCLNCDEGVSSTPCNQCSSCNEITEGRFVDLIEVDAASRTKVEDTRELLDNVQYAPTRGRYKVYLIDEVHMLSNHSFNALLKTLEEPPPHVKFLLATTDPQKLPVTILSRCLQFNLKNLNPERIVGHLKHVLTEEKVPFEESALWQLGRAADGSMRDALSLTDQAIAHGGGTLTAAEVNAMLGTIDRSSVVGICQAVAAGDAAAAMALVEHMADHAPDFSQALADMLTLWHQVAIAQTTPDALDPGHEYHQQVLDLASQVSREDIQLCYQITLLGRRDLPYAADPRSGFEMVLLRLVAFRPLDQEPPGTPPPARHGQVTPGSGASAAEVAAPAKKPEPPPSPAPAAPAPDRSPISDAPGAGQAPESSAPMAAALAALSTPVSAKPAPAPAPTAPVPEPVDMVEPSGGNSDFDDYESYLAATARNEPPPVAAAVPVPAAAPDAASDIVPAADRIPFAELASHNWHQVCEHLGLGGVLGNNAANLVIEAVEGNAVRFVLDRENSALYDDSQQQRLAEALSAYFGCDVRATIQVAAVDRQTPRMIAEQRRAERLQEAIAGLRADPHIQELTRVFGAELVESSVKPID